MDEKIKEYLAFIGSKGGRTTGSAKARKMGREHYAKIAEIQRERWRKYRKAKEASIRSGSASK